MLKVCGKKMNGKIQKQNLGYRLDMLSIFFFVCLFFCFQIVSRLFRQYHEQDGDLETQVVGILKGGKLFKSVLEKLMDALMRTLLKKVSEAMPSFVSFPCHSLFFFNFYLFLLAVPHHVLSLFFIFGFNLGSVSGIRQRLCHGG